MTEVRIHGYLSKFFDSRMKIHLGKVSDIFRALFAIKPGFREKLMDLQKRGYNYTYIINKNIVDIFPLISGFSKAVRTVVAVVLIVVGIVLMYTGIGSLLGMALISIGISLLLYKDPKFPSIQGVKTGGASLLSGNKSQSYIFSNYQNTASQGSAIPIGYGKYSIPSKIIAISTKNYSTSQTFISEVNSSAKDNIFTFIL